MTKSDLKTGMKVTTRSGLVYFVMLDTGFLGEEKDVLVRRVGKDTGWMPLSMYDDNLLLTPDPDDFLDDFLVESVDHGFDIVRVDRAYNACDLFTSNCYKTVWTRQESAPSVAN